MLVRLLTRLAQIVLLSLLCLGNVRPAQAAVSLVSFTATGEPNRVVVEWETATELGISGFYVWRSTTETGTYQRVSDLYEPQGDQFVGAVYEYLDNSVTNGTLYWYQLEVVNPPPQSSEFFGPESATPGVQQTTGTPSVTPTVTQTSTPTATSTNQTTTLTATPTATNLIDPTITRTVAPSTAAATRTPSTAYPAPRTATPVPPPAAQAATQTGLALPPSPTLPTSTPSPTLVVTATITLLPFPELTLTFPEGGILLPGRVTPTSTPTQVSPASGAAWFPTGGILLIVILVVIWSLLGVWFYLSFQRIQ